MRIYMYSIEYQDELCKKNDDDMDIMPYIPDHTIIESTITMDDKSGKERFDSVFNDTDIVTYREEYDNTIKLELDNHYQDSDINNSKDIYTKYQLTDKYHFSYLAWLLYKKRDDFISIPVDVYIDYIYRIYSYYIIITGILSNGIDMLDMQIIFYISIAINFANIYNYILHNNNVANIFSIFINKWSQIYTNAYNINRIKDYGSAIRYIYLRIYRAYHVYKYTILSLSKPRFIYDIEMMIWQFYINNTRISFYDNYIKK